ncbi:MAG TPA: methyltransferase domain-containing protein [Streptosporangiaceae bacterium]|nr:methyltransferase domain-containing protein [Streptosporangiaceae bacterium]
MGPGAAHLGRLLDFAQPVADDVCLDVAYGAGPIAAALRHRVRRVTSVDAGPRPDPRHPGPQAAPDTAPHALPPVSAQAPPFVSPASAPATRTATAPTATSRTGVRAGEVRAGHLHADGRRGAVPPVQASTLALPYRDDVFTLVTAQLALNSLADPLTSVREMLRVCRPDGRLVIAGRVRTNAASAARDRLERLRDPAHTGTPALSRLTGLLAEAGAQVRRLDVFVVERPAEPWLAGCDDMRADLIRAALFAEIDGGPPTGVRPRMIGGELWFTQSWAHIAAVPR